MKKLTLVLSASLALFCVKSQAHPYASGVSNNGGTITFHLNETVTNGQVYVLFDSGSVSNVPAGIPNNGTNVARGVYSFSLGAHTNYSINVFKVGSGVASQISPTPAAGSNTNWDFWAPRSVAINRNPKSPYFGTIYVANQADGGDAIRANMHKGIYAMYADGSDRFGYGNTAQPPTNATPTPGTITWSDSSSYGPYGIFVGPDDMLYVSDATFGSKVGGGVWMLSPDLTNVTPLFTYNGGPAGEGAYVDSLATVARGSYAAGTLDLYSIEWDRSPYQSVWKYSFYDNSTSPPTPLPLPWQPSIQFPSGINSDGGCPDIYNYGQNNPNFQVSAGIGNINTVLCQFTIGPDGRFYCCEPRNNAANVNLWIYDAETNGACLLYDDLDSTGNPAGFGTFWGAEAVAVSDDNNLMAVCTFNINTNYGFTGGKILYTTFSSDAAHLPNVPPTAINYHPGSTSTLVRGVTFDPADNVYAGSGSDDTVRGFSLGLTTLTVYSNDTTGTNGSFQLIQPGSQISVAATTPVASQNHGSPTPGVFTLTRTGTASALAQALTVNFTLTGTATQAPWTNPVPFTASSTSSVNFAANQTTATVTINPLNDNVSRPTLTVNLNVTGSQVYSVTPPTSATVYIVNTGPQVLSLSTGGLPSMYRSLGKDYATATLSRWGDTNAASYTVPAANFTYGGTATANVDFTGLAQPLNVNGAATGSQDITINPGDASETIMVGNPTATTSYVGDKTILLGLNSGSGYTAATNQATLTILDNHYQNETLIWSNALTSASDSTNWTVAFGSEAVSTVVYPNYPNYTASTAPQNFDVEFGYSLATDGVGLPPNGSSTALKVTMNKNSTTGAEGGVSIYPQGVNLSGNYAVRFSMAFVHGSSFTTEFCQFGINHFGTNNLWWAGATPTTYGNINIDGVWYSISADVGGAALGDILSFVGQPLPNSGWLIARPQISESGFANVFKNPAPYSTGGGAGAPGVQNGGDESAWTDVEIMQSNNIVTLSMNRTPIVTYTNTVGGNTGGGVYTSGVPMIGYCDPFRSVGSPNLTAGDGPCAAMFVSNIRAVNLSTAAVAPKITNTQVSGGNVVITFTTTSQSDTTANFFLQAEPVVQTTGNTWADVSPAANITGGSGTFQATVPVNGTTQFYRIRHN